MLLGHGPVLAGPPATRSLGSSSQEDPVGPSITNEWCPVLTDERVDPEIHAEFLGEQIYFCCQKCLKQFRADPAAYAGNVPALASLTDARNSGDSETDGGEHAHGGEADEVEHAHGGETDDGEHAKEQEAEQHDHADHAASESLGLVRWLGRVHPMIIHFPIALLLMAAAAELLLILTGRSHFAFAARFCLWGGAVCALIAAPLGWADALSVADDYSGFSAKLLFFHRWVGVATALAAGVALFAGERSWGAHGESWKRFYRATLFLSALLVAVAGHLGASLIYGWEYLSW